GGGGRGGGAGDCGRAVAGWRRRRRDARRPGAHGEAVGRATRGGPAGAVRSVRRDLPDRARALLGVAGVVLAVAWSGMFAKNHLGGEASTLDRIEAPLLDLRFQLAGPRQPK